MTCSKYGLKFNLNACTYGLTADQEWISKLQDAGVREFEAADGGQNIGAKY